MIIKDLDNKFSNAISKAFPGVPEACSMVEVTQSTQDSFGHYQCNSAMKLAKLLKQNPRAIAQKIVDNFDKKCDDKTVMVEELSIAGPGFINVWLDKNYIGDIANDMLRDSHLGVAVSAQPKKVVVDFSSPNIAKEMHVGHLRSTIIGDCLSRLLEFLGHDVLRLNHVGDWGTSFGMLIAYLKENYPEIIVGDVETDLSHLVGWYRAAKQLFDEDSDFKVRAQRSVVDLQSGDPQAIKAWEIICEISRRAYQEVYDLLDVDIEERGESFYNPMLAGIVADLESKGLIEESDGAKCIFLEGFTSRDGKPLPLIIQKSDGGYNYATTDMAALRHRIEEEHAEEIVYITDGGQGLHFKMVFEAAKKAGYLDSEKVEVRHVPFGLVLRSDGKKFRTRSGETERLVDLLNYAVVKARDIIVERGVDATEDEIDLMAKHIGIGAVKYADLSCLRTKDYVFNYDRMLQFEGNTAVFLMYAYVRVAGIKRKIGIDDIGSLQDEGKIVLEHPSEVALALGLGQFGEALYTASQELLPNRLTDYLYGLAERFNAFFRDCRVEGSEQQTSRLLLCEAVALVIQKGMELLGLKVVNRM